MGQMTQPREVIGIPNLADPATFAEGVPHDAFDTIRALPGLYWNPTPVGTHTGGFWAVTRPQDIVKIEADTATFTSSQGGAFPLPPKRPVEFDFHLMTNDPPNHSRIRRAAARSFGPRIVAHFDGWVREIVVEVLDAACAKGEFDWVTDVAAIIPARVIARVVGTPPEKREYVVGLVLDLFRALAVTEDGGAGGREISKILYAFMDDLWRKKVLAPEEDMATVLGQCVERVELNAQECNAFLALLAIAGFETTHTMMGHAMRMILEDQGVQDATMEAVRDGRTLVAIDEFLRIITPAMNMARVATRPVDFNGTHIREGDMVQLFFTAANRDPMTFDEPHTFKLDRPNSAGHLAFGSGPHACMGANLAKLELRILFEELASRNIRLRLNGEPKRGWSMFVNQLTALPVAVVD